MYAFNPGHLTSGKTT